MRSDTPELQLNNLYEDWLRFGADGHLRSCSDRLRERWTATGLLSTADQASDFFALAADGRDVFSQAWAAAAEGSASCLNLRLQGSDGPVRSMVLIPEFDEAGTIVSVVAGALRLFEKNEVAAPGPLDSEDAISKLSELRALLKETTQANRKLEDALAAARAEIKLGKSENRAKIDFLAMISHEIRTPMNAVIGFCDLLSSTSLTKEQGEFVDAINHSGKLLIDLIGQVLDYSKIESGHLHLESEEFFLESIFQEVQAILSVKARGRKIGYKVDYDQVSHEALVGDPTRLKQVLINLLSNAFKFTEEGEVSLTATTPSSEFPGHLCLRVRVEDTGIGIAPERISSLFCPFAQANNEISRQFGGTGLGLAISKRLCQAMQGDIWIERTGLGEGSVFVLEIHLPYKNVAAPETEVISGDGVKEASRQSPAVRLLVVDDNPNNLLITSKLSQYLGYESETVNSGVAALQRMKEDSFDIVLMDVRMAPINGMETTRMIREGEAGDGSSSAYIIAVTAHALDGDKERCFQSGMNDYLSKPLTLERLEESLNRARSELSLD